MSTVEYQLLTRLEQIKSRVLEIRTRAGLAAATPLIDRVTNIIQQRRAMGGILGRIAAPPAPAAPPAQTQVEQYGFVETQEEEELGIEAR